MDCSVIPAPAAQAGTLDPNALEISHDTAMPDGVAGDHATGPAKRAVDTDPITPKGVVFAPDVTSTAANPTREFKDDVVYETHLGGLTRNDNSAPAAWQGTDKGAGLKAPYPASLGVTAVEFLPMQETRRPASSGTGSPTRHSGRKAQDRWPNPGGRRSSAGSGPTARSTAAASSS